MWYTPMDDGGGGPHESTRVVTPCSVLLVAGGRDCEGC
jgi:hypothetical protein